MRSGTADVSEAVVLARIKPGIEGGLIDFEKRSSGGEPEMGLLIGGPPVAQIGNTDETGSAAVGDIEGGFLIVVALNYAGDVIGPRAGLGGSEAHAQRVASIPESTHEISGCSR